MKRMYVRGSSDLIPFVARVGFDYGDAEHGPSYSWHEELVYARSAREAQDIVDKKYSYKNTGEPYEGSFIQYASQEDVDRLSHAPNYDDVKLPFEIDGCTIASSEAIIPEEVYDNVANEALMKQSGMVLDGVVISDEGVRTCEGILKDNGVDPEIAKDVMQAIGYELLSIELYPEEDKNI